MPLHTRHIPDNFDNFFGNDSLVDSLISVIDRKEDIPQVFLFHGPAGMGKSTLAEILKNELKIHDLDFYSINCSDKGNIDDIRKIIRHLPLAPTKSKKKMFLLEECHRMSPQAKETLLDEFLKLPKHVVFILCTTEPQSLKPTLRRRCHDYRVEPLLYDDMLDFLNYILEKEEIDNLGMDAIVEKIIEISNGSPGIALKILDKVIDIEDLDKALTVIEETTFDRPIIKEICQLLLIKKEDKWNDMRLLSEKLEGEPESNRIAILMYLNKVLHGKNYADNIFDMMACLEDGPVFYSRKTSLTCALFLACKE